ncbi:MAG: hypothetical protein ABIK65_00875 [Candidatus Eisenbacteria bacterium]
MAAKGTAAGAGGEERDVTAMDHRGFALSVALLAVIILVPLALAALTLTGIEDRASERSTDLARSLHRADGGCLVAAERLARLDEGERPSVPVQYMVDGQSVLVEPAGADAWTITCSSGSGRDLAGVRTTVRWDGGSWSLVDYESVDGAFEGE